MQKQNFIEPPGEPREPGEGPGAEAARAAKAEAEGPAAPAEAGAGGSEELAWSHVVAGERAGARMVDVGDKEATRREALASARLVFPDDLLGRILAGGGTKGAYETIEEAARLAGILAAKRTGELIPLCHPLGLDHVEITFRAQGGVLEIRCRAAVRARTGVEMEAMVGASVAALTVYDMTKALSKGIRVERVELLEKRGGRSGHWTAPGHRASGG